MDVLKAPQQWDEGGRQQAAAHSVVIVMVTATKNMFSRKFKTKSGSTILMQFLSIYMVKQSRSGLTMLSRHSVGTYQENELNATREEMLVHSHLKSLGHCGLLPGLKSGVDGHKLISTNNNNKIKNRKIKIKFKKKTSTGR